MVWFPAKQMVFFFAFLVSLFCWVRVYGERARFCEYELLVKESHVKCQSNNLYLSPPNIKKII